MISPVYNVKRIPLEKIQANAYNPNAVAPPEMKLLELSIWEDGFTMPVAATSGTTPASRCASPTASRR